MGKASHKKKRRRNDSPTVAPLSESLIKLAHSVCENPNSFSIEQTKTLISIAAMAWNLSLFPKESRAQQVQALMTGPIDGNGGSLLRRLRNEIVAKKSDKEILPTMAMLDLISIMLRKKDELYPDDKMLIVNYKITSLGSGEYNVTVASTDIDTAGEPNSPGRRWSINNIIHIKWLLSFFGGMIKSSKLSRE